MKIAKILTMFFAVFFSINSFAGVVSKERGIDYYYGEENEKKCKKCKGTGKSLEKTYIVNKDKSLTEHSSKITKCPICKGTKKQRRIIDFKKIILPKSKKIYDLCTIKKFAFPNITILHLNGESEIHVKQLPKSIIRILATWIRMDSSSNYYIMHNAQMPGVIGGLIGAFKKDYFLKTYLKGLKRIRIKKDKNDNYYFFQAHCREHWGNRHKNNKYLIIKTNLLNFTEVMGKVKNKKLMYIRILDLVKSISNEEMKKMKWKQTENGKISEKKLEVNAEILLSPDKKTIFKILKGELAVKNKFADNSKNINKKNLQDK